MIQTKIENYVSYIHIRISSAETKAIVKYEQKSVNDIFVCNFFSFKRNETSLIQKALEKLLLLKLNNIEKKTATFLIFTLEQQAENEGQFYFSSS